MTFDGKAFGSEIVGVVKSYLAKELSPLSARIDALEKRIDAIPAPVDLSRDLASLKAAVEAIKMPEIPKAPELPDIASMVDKAVDIAVAALPPAEKGVGLAGALIDRDGELVVTLTNGEVEKLGPVVGKNGEDGTPGFNLEDFDASLMEDGRTVLLSFTGKDIDYKVELGFPAMIYRGVYREGSYEKGDTVTWGGSLWHCDAEKTEEKPGDGSKAWTLCAKKGRDGRDGEAKEAKPQQPVRVGVPTKGE